MSWSKALAAMRNGALPHGSTKNWNGIFAFPQGPEGRHSVHAALAAVPGAAGFNAAPRAAVAEGQFHLPAERRVAVETARVERLLRKGAPRLFHVTLNAAG